MKSRRRRKKKEERKKRKEKSRWKQWPASLRPPPRVAHASTPGPKLVCPKKYIGKKKFDQQKILSEILWPKIFYRFFWPPKNVVNKFWLKKMLVEIVFGWKKLLVEIFFIAENEYWSSIFCRFFVLFCSVAEAWTNPSPWSILSTLIAFHWLRGYPESLFCHSPTLPNSTQVGVTRLLICYPLCDVVVQVSSNQNSSKQHRQII